MMFQADVGYPVGQPVLTAYVEALMGVSYKVGRKLGEVCVVVIGLVF